MEAIEHINEAIVNGSKMIKQNIGGYGQAPDRETDDNINRLEKLIVIRSALRQLFELPETEDLEEPENFDAPTIEEMVEEGQAIRDLQTDPPENIDATTLVQ